MNPRNLAETLVPIGLKFGIIIPTVEAMYVDGEKRLLSVRGNSSHDLNVKLLSARTFLDAKKVEPTEGNVLCASGYLFPFANKTSPLLNRQELGGNRDGGLKKGPGHS